MTFVERMIGAARLDAAVYEEVEADRSATPQALAVVVISGLAAGVGAGAGLRGLIAATVLGILGWAIWAVLIYFIGTRWFPEPNTRADIGELLRTLGFASTPGIIRVIGIVPVLFHLASVVATLWILVAVVVAVRQALDYTSTGRAVGVCLVGWLVQIGLAILLRGIVGGLGPR
jgi:hypothetical protein